MTKYTDRMARRVDVYLPTPGDKKRWKTIAHTKGATLSKWIVATLEETLAQSEGGRSHKELLKEIRENKDTIAQLREKNRQYDIIIDKLEKELRGYRAQPFITKGFQGIRRYDTDLVNLLRETKTVEGKPKPVSDEDIMRYLGIKLSETENLKAISHQLEILEAYGLVESTPKGWRWKE